METGVKVSITDMGSDGTISVLTREYIEHNGKETILDNHREALCPGQFERARQILPDNLYNAVKELWTDEVVSAWEERIKMKAEEREGGNTTNE